MVNTNGLAIFVLTAGMSVCTTEQARAERSIFGKKISKNDQIRVQQARLNRLEERIEKMRLACISVLHFKLRRFDLCLKIMRHRVRVRVMTTGSMFTLHSTALLTIAFCFWRHIAIVGASPVMRVEQDLVTVHRV